MNHKESIILIGGGGHCRSVIDVIEAEDKYDIVGIVDNHETKSVLGYPILGTDDNLPELIQEHKNCLITVGQIKSSEVRKKLFEKVKSLGATVPVIVSPFSRVSRTSKLGEGTVVMHSVMVNSNTVIGENNIINTGAIIEHDVVIGSNNHISTRVVLNGGASLRNNSFIGSGTVVNQGVEISSNIVVGASSLVLKDITEGGTYIGQPINKIK